MLLKKHYLIVGALIALALVASFLLMPGHHEFALMQMKDKHFAEAREAYEQEMARGDVSLETVNHLTDLYLQVGAIDKAIVVLEKYVAEHPNNLDVRTKLGTLYQYAQRPDDYMHNLEAINKIKAQPENLKALSNIYNFRGEYDKQASTLKQLVKEEHGKDAKHYTDLATIQAAKHDYAGAIATLNELQRTQPEHFDFSDEALLVSLLIDAQKPDEAESNADAWVTQRHNADEASQLINILHYKGNIGGRLISHFTKQEIDTSPALLDSYVLLLLGRNEDKKAYAYLKALYEADQLPPALNGRLLFLAASQGDGALSHRLLQNTDLSTLSEMQLTALVDLALVQHDKPLLTSITRHFSDPAAREHFPMLAAALAVANHSADANDALAKLDGATLTNEQIFEMADICVHAARYSCSDHFLSRLPPQDKLTDADIANLGNLYIAMHEWQQGDNYLAQAMQTHKSDMIADVKVQFAAALGNTAEVQSWLSAHPDASENTLSDLYFLAMNNHHSATAIVVAEIFHSKYNTPLSRTLLADAYIKSGRYESALELLRQNTMRSQDDENNYLTALTKLSRTNPAYRQELGHYAAERLRSHVSESQKMALVYALINAGQANVAMPYIRELALSNGGQWAALYADQLEKEGKYEEARGFWLSVAEQPYITREQKQSIAYALLDHGYKSDAEKLLMELAADAPPNSQAMNDLLFLWGPRPTNEEMEWMETRYNSAPDFQKTEWAKLIAEYARPGFLIKFVSRHPETMNNSEVADAYMQALIDAGAFASKQQSFVSYAQKNNNSELMRAYGNAAANNGYMPQATVAYATLATIEPTDYIALREAGVTAYESANYSTSSRYLAQYIRQYNQNVTIDPFAYQPFFFYGELLRHYHHPKEAVYYYRIALALIGPNPATAEALSKRAQSQIWSGDTMGGLTTFDTGRKLYPDNDDLRADYIETLIDLNCYDQARALLPPGNSTAPRPIMAETGIPAFNQDVVDYTVLNRSSELLVQFKGPMSQDSIALSRTFKSIPGIGYTSEGYDTLLIGANSGYKFRMNGQTPVLTPDNVSLSAEDNQRLRYRLLDARLDLATGHVYRAAENLNALLPQYKNNPQLLGFTANAENYGGNWAQAEQLLKTAHALAPDDQDVNDLLRDARREHAENIRLDYDWYSIGNSHENIETLSGYVDVNNHLIVGTVLQENEAHASNVRLANGQVGSFSGDRDQGEIYAQYSWENGRYVKASLFGNDDSVGAGGYFHFLTPLGETMLAGEWHRPYWDEIVEAALDDATRDRIALQQVVKPNDKLTLTLEPGLNRYNTSYEDDVESTFSLDGLAVYRYLERERLYLDLGYMLDAEYELNEKDSVDDTGAYTREFPLHSREIHMLFEDTGYTFNSSTYGDLLLGYEYDRLGGNGPAISAKLTHEFTQKFDAQLRAYYGLDTGNSANELAQVGGYLRWRF